MVELNTPEEAAEFVVRNIAGLTPAQIADLEKAVTGARPDMRIDGVNLRDITVAVVYGCRVLKAVERMKDIRKMADRWSLAWNGTERTAGVLTIGNIAWTELCREYWNPFMKTHFERALGAAGKNVDPDAGLLFYPELS